MQIYGVPREVFPQTFCYVLSAVTNLRNGVRKNGDKHIYTHQSDQSPYYPGIVIELGYSDSRRKSRRDIRLWLENSDCDVFEVKRLTDVQVKLGIACKIGVNAEKQIDKLTFDIFDFDFDLTQTSRTRPLGRARLLESFVCLFNQFALVQQDWSTYDGTDQILPPITTYQIPSYTVFSDGIYPPSFPEHPAPPNALPVVKNVGREHHLLQQGLDIANEYVRLFNTQRSPITVNFRTIAQGIRKSRW